MAQGEAFPLVRVPQGVPALPVLVSIPHFGTDAVPGIGDADYCEARFRHFRFGYTDPFARQIYGRLDACGATVVATPFSRLFVDVNRARDDFRVCEGAVQSARGVVRTHVRDERALFVGALSRESVERRLAAFYDPYHDALAGRLAELRRRFGGAVLVDGHTTGGERLGGHDVAIGTGRGRACSRALAGGVQDIVRGYGFSCAIDVPGYAGGHIVRRYGAPHGAVEALQIEFDATGLMDCSRRAHSEARRRGALPEHDEVGLARCIACMADVVRWLGGGGRRASS